jgi:uncharacterized protein (TIGR03000 family)
MQEALPPYTQPPMSDARITSMKAVFVRTFIIALLTILSTSVAFGGRGGGGGFHGGGGWGGGRDFGGYHSESGGFHEGEWGSFSNSRSSSGGWDGRGWAGTSSYNRSYTGDRGGSVDVSGTRGAAVGPNGAAAGSTRDVTATGPGGRSYSASGERGAAVGPGGAVAGGERSGVATGPGGTVAGSSRWGGAATRFPTDAGFAHYSTAAVGNFGHPTAYWSGGYMATRAGFVRGGFYQYGAFYPGWYTAHPGAWAAAGWAAGTAWTACTAASLASFCSIPAVPVYFDYGNTIVYQNTNVYENGQVIGTTADYEQQAQAIAQQGQAAPPPSQKWQPLGVFALVQGDDKSSNSMFQLAVDPSGIIRGNYYDALMDSTSTVYGSVDKKTQRAAWTIGDKKTPLFEAGIFNLTKDESPVLVHFGPGKTQQWLLVRVQHQDAPPKPAPPAAGSSSSQGTAATALVTVIVPADARVFFDGTPTNETGSRRTFTTPLLASGHDFGYDIEAQWSENGQTFDQTRKITVTAGANVTVDFTVPQP